MTRKKDRERNVPRPSDEAGPTVPDTREELPPPGQPVEPVPPPVDA